MKTEIKTESVVHPIIGVLSKKYIYTYDDDNKQINKEFFLPTKNLIVSELEKYTTEEIETIKQILNIQ